MLNNSNLNSLLSLSESFLQKSMPEKAKYILLSIISQYPENSKANELLAYACGLLNNETEAIHFLKIACLSNECSYSALYELGTFLLANSQPDEAIQYLQRAVNLEPNFFEALHDLGAALALCGNYNTALDTFRQAELLNNKSFELYFNIAKIYDDQNDLKTAIIYYTKSLEINSSYVIALINRAYAYHKLKMHLLAISDYQIALTISPLDNCIAGLLLHEQMLVCEWNKFEAQYEYISKNILAGHLVAEPFGLQGFSCSEQELLDCAEKYTSQYYPAKESLSSGLPIYRPYEKIKIGYVCGEFKEHATSFLITELIELHDKNRFEVYAFDNGFDDGSAIRKRLNCAFDNIINISNLSDYSAAKKIFDLNIDILINLNGYYGKHRMGIFSFKPSPIQINYLGFPGTLGALYFDYIIADKTVIPLTSSPFYTEKIIYLPFTYQVNDRKKLISYIIDSKNDHGLPDNLFIYCCFNNNYKITPHTLNLWCKILTLNTQSVLWLLKDSDLSMANLLKELKLRGIEKNRVIFADRISLSAHLSRHRHADLFLDTFPYNAHTTASDALWSGLPLLTLQGNTFPGRVASSLLSAVGLSDLITTSDEEFIRTAVNLANQPIQLEEIRTRLKKNIHYYPLFDTKSFAENFEKGLMEAYLLFMKGEKPKNIFIS